MNFHFSIVKSIKDVGVIHIRKYEEIKLPPVGCGISNVFSEISAFLLKKSLNFHRKKSHGLLALVATQDQIFSPQTCVGSSGEIHKKLEKHL